MRATIAHRRAPAGAADELIRRILTERHHRGASALEIHAAAAGMETLVSLSGVRFALDRGRNGGIYRNKDGKWFLIEKAAQQEQAAE